MLTLADSCSNFCKMFNSPFFKYGELDIIENFGQNFKATRIILFWADGNRWERHIFN